MKKNLLLIIVSILLVWSQNGESAWVFKPASSNVKEGDVILSRSPNSAVGKVMAALGQYWDHSMMVVEEENGEGSLMTDCSFEQSYLEDLVRWRTGKIIVTIYIPFPIPIPYDVKLPVNFDPIKLANLSRNKRIPSAISTGTIRSKGDESKGKIMAVLTVRSEDNRVHLQGIAEIMKNMQGYYIFNAFVKLRDFMPLSGAGALLPGQGSHCSGPIWWANHLYGKDMDLFPLDNTNGVLTAAAGAMHRYVRDYVRGIIKKKINEMVQD